MATSNFISTCTEAMLACAKFDQATTELKLATAAFNLATAIFDFIIKIQHGLYTCQIKFCSRHYYLCKLTLFHSYPRHFPIATLVQTTWKLTLFYSYRYSLGVRFSDMDPHSFLYLFKFISAQTNFNMTTTSFNLTCIKVIFACIKFDQATTDLKLATAALNLATAIFNLAFSNFKIRIENLNLVQLNLISIGLFCKAF